MAKRGPTYRIDPIEPDQVAARFSALLDRLAPVLDPLDVDDVRSMLTSDDLGPAYERLDAVTNEVTAPIDTALLVELVLLGQAIRPGAG